MSDIRNLNTHAMLTDTEVEMLQNSRSNLMRPSEKAMIILLLDNLRAVEAQNKLLETQSSLLISIDGRLKELGKGTELKKTSERAPLAEAKKA